MNSNYIRILQYLNKYSDTNQRKVSKELNISLGSINSILKDLNNKGLIQIQKEQGKKLKYNLTDEALELLDGHIRKLHELKIEINERSNVKTGIILGAGENSFKTPIGKAKIYSKSLLDIQIECLKNHGIDNILVVVGYKKELYENHIQHDNVKYIENNNYLTTGTMESLVLCKEFIEGDIIIWEGDVWCENVIIKKLISHKNINSIVLSPSHNKDNKTYVEVRDKYIYKFGKDRCQFKNIDGELMGVCKISNSIYMKMLEAFKGHNNSYMNFEYSLLDVAGTYNIGYFNMEDLKWIQVNDFNDIKIVESFIQGGTYNA